MGVGGTDHNLENHAMQKVEEIRKKVSENQGDVVLCFRKFTTGTPGSHYEDSLGYESGYIETGIISGDLRSSEVYQTMELSSIKIDFSGRNNNYPLFSSHKIPVKNKLVNGSLGGLNLNFSESALEKACEGGIAFGSHELSNPLRVLELLGYEKKFPRLDSIDFYFGDKEIRDSFQGKVLPRKIDEFIKLMKTPGEIQRRVNDYRFEKRKNLAEELVIYVSDLLKVDRRIRGIEKDVLNSRLRMIWGQGERYEDWGGNKEEVIVYGGLKVSASGFLKKIKEKLEKSGEIKLIELPKISGEGLGFPAEVSSQEYLKNLENKVLPEVEGRLKKLNSHIREQRKKAKGG